MVVSPIALAILPDIDLAKVYRQVAEELATYLPNGSLDLKVYERRRLWRLVNSQHGESKLFKIQLPYPIPTLEKILKLARNQQPINALHAAADVVL